VEMLQDRAGMPPKTYTNIMYNAKSFKLEFLRHHAFRGRAKAGLRLGGVLLTPAMSSRSSVFKNPDLLLDARVSEAGTIGFRS